MLLPRAPPRCACAASSPLQPLAAPLAIPQRGGKPPAPAAGPATPLCRRKPPALLQAPCSAANPLLRCTPPAQIHPRATKPAREGPDVGWTSGIVGPDAVDPAAAVEEAPEQRECNLSCATHCAQQRVAPAPQGLPLAPWQALNQPHTTHNTHTAKGPPRKYHVVTSAQGSAVHWQVRVHYYW